MVAKRRRAEKLPACQTMEEAVQMLGRFAVLDTEVAARKARVDAAIAQLRAEAETLNAPAEAEIKNIFLAMKPWWAVVSEEITEGKRKSAELAGCLIGHRIGNPTLVFPKPEEYAIAVLEKEGFFACVRVVKELDKAALLARLKPDDEDAPDLRLLGFGVKQTETFFIAQLPPKEPDSETITDPQAAQVPA